MKNKQLPDIEELNNLFEYDPETGIITHKDSKEVATSYQGRGYLTVRAKKQTFLAHRVAFAMHHGKDPGDNYIDHINHIHDDNRACNLRAVTPKQNSWNSRAKGIQQRASGRWTARIRDAAGKLIGLGTYDCPLMARIAYEDKAREIRGDYSAA